MDSKMKTFCRIFMYIAMVFCFVSPALVYSLFVAPKVEVLQKTQAEIDERNNYGSHLFAVSVNSKTNSSGEYFGGNYYQYVCSFSITIKNNSQFSVNSVYGEMKVKNDKDEELASFEIGPAKDIASGSQKTVTNKIYFQSSQKTLELYNTEFDDLNFYVRVTYANFSGNSDGISYKDSEYVLTKSSKSNSSNNQQNDDNN